MYRLYLFSYDLIADKDYRNLENTLISLGAIRVLKSQWLLPSVDTGEDLYKKLASTVDNDDRVLLVEVRRNGYFERLMIPDLQVRALFGSAAE